MDYHNNTDGLANLEKLAEKISRTLNGNLNRGVPIVLVPGFSGWGTPLFGAINYWGGIENLPEQLAAEGHTVIVTPIAPISSNWERACELYAQLTSPKFTIYDLEAKKFPDHPDTIDVDYGENFPRKHGYVRVARGRKAAILFTQNPGEWENWVWNDQNPVHFVCHSQGGNTVRYLLHLLERGSLSRDNTPTHSRYFEQPGRSKWAISVFTIGTPHRGTTVIDVLHDLFKTSNLSEKTKLIGRLFATLSFNDPNDRIYDLQLDHWGIKRCNRGPSQKETFSEMRTRLESMTWQSEAGPVRKWIESNHNGFYDNSILGVNELNDKTIPTSCEIYYFSLSFSCVQKFPKHWPPWTLEALQRFPLTIGRFLTSIPLVGNVAQFLQGVVKAIPFVGNLVPDIPKLSAQFAEEIYKLILTNIASVGGWHIISTLVNLQDVVKWSVNSAINPFLDQVGYNVRIPEPGNYLPITSIFPLMFVTAYAMGGKNLSVNQKHVLGEDASNWHLNDGVVNTESMKGPLNRNGDLPSNRNQELIADACEFPLGQVHTARGKYWHFGVTSGIDHADEIGIFIQETTANATVKMYKDLVAIVSHLPQAKIL
ncbi:hypothetical protein B7463_g8516, partial [Scytalidium lignicola]